VVVCSDPSATSIYDASCDLDDGGGGGDPCGGDAFDPSPNPACYAPVPPPPPPPPALTCKSLSPVYRPVNAEPVQSSNGPGWYAASYFGFQASGGTDSYTWLEDQSYELFSSVTLSGANSPVDYSRSGSDPQLASQQQPGNIIVYADAPGLPETWTGGATVTSGTYVGRFNLSVTVTSGTQVVTCPSVAWYAIVNVTNGMGSGSGASGLLAH
jgi:hypothetical protein